MPSWSRWERTNPENRMAPLWLSRVAYDEHHPEEFLAQLRAYVRLSGDEAAGDRLRAAEQGFRSGGEDGMRSALGRLAVLRAGASQSFLFDAAQELEGAGHTADALLLLQKAVAARDVSVQSIEDPRDFAHLRGLPAFQDLVKRVRTPLPDSSS